MLQKLVSLQTLWNLIVLHRRYSDDFEVQVEKFTAAVVRITFLTRRFFSR